MNQSSIHLTRKVGEGAIVVGIAAMMGVTAPVALAHDSVIGGNVTEGEVLDEFPDEFTLEFSGIPREGFNKIAITDQGTGKVIFSEEPEINDRELSIDTPDDVDPGAGEYLIGFKIVSSDGHATRGGVNFSVRGSDDASSQAESSEAAGSASDSSNGDPAEESTAPDQLEEATKGMSTTMKWVLAGAGVLAVIAVLAVMLAKRRGYDA